MHSDWSISYGLLCQLIHGKIVRLLNYFIKVVGHKFPWFIGMINHLGCWKNTRKIRKSLACGS